MGQRVFVFLLGFLNVSKRGRGLQAGFSIQGRCQEGLRMVLGAPSCQGCAGEPLGHPGGVGLAGHGAVGTC